MPMPVPTLIYRLMHIDNLDVCLQRGGMHAPNMTPQDGLEYRAIHNIEIQNRRHQRPIPCGPRGTIHDYVPFYFGPRSPMLLQLHTGQVAGYDEGQTPLIYAVSMVEAVVHKGLGFAFSDGHGIAFFTDWYDDVADLDKVDWKAVYARQWNDTLDDPDRQRRKQAEFLVHSFLPWSLVTEVAVVNETMKERALNIITSNGVLTPVTVRGQWYY